ncbi:hypothetical protein LOTGIDRAFT_232590 [Lottia gigantea]|uniref:Uncharacterized protein n=1 Tax=Lottia gigantea TaxID=225164 RepID=V3ZQ44_LOTGI|nr:hypothetical protein LOTGIDRAFT_232590 [Lottia gigantea]ESO93508.1 hypothetical protein LOTGIDRAFT_232590 [Lottia gigantea]
MSRMDGYLNPSAINYEDRDAKPSPHFQKQNQDVNSSDTYLDMQNQNPKPKSQNHMSNISPTSQDGYLNPHPSQHGRKEKDASNSNIFNLRISPKPDEILHPRNSDQNQNIPPNNRPTNHQPSQNSYINDHHAPFQTSAYLNPHPTQYDLERQQRINSGKTRFDSGVGDLEMNNVSPLPRNSKAYEYMDSPNHYEEVPTLQRQPPDLLVGRPPVNDLIITQSTDDTDDNTTVFRSTTKRKYTNPLYSRMVSVASSFFSDDKTSSSPVKQVDHLEKQVCCQCVLILILLIVTLGSTALCVYLMIQSETYVSTNELLLRIQKLEGNMHKSSALKGNISGGVDYNLQQISMNRDQIEFTYKNLSSQLNSITDNLQQQIDNVSKMEGPPGVGNLTACFYKNLTSSSIASGFSSTTSYGPSLTDLDTNVIMSASCLVVGGLRAKLEINFTDDKLQYRCRCEEKIPGAKTRICTLHMLLCPKFS